MKIIPSSNEDQYVVVFTEQEEQTMDRLVNVIYYTAISLIVVFGLVWLANKPFKK